MERRHGLIGAVGVLAQAAMWVVLLFGLTRIAWVQDNILFPFARFQGGIACRIAGTPADSVYVDLSCTGSDAMALCVGAILAFPAVWRRRLLGSALGLGLILVLNTARIGTLSLVVDRPTLFGLLHVYLWPAVVIVVTAVFVFYWIGTSPAPPERTQPAAPPRIDLRGPRTLRFLSLVVLLVGLFYLGSRWIFTSSTLLVVAGWSASTAAFLMTALGGTAAVGGNMFQTPYGNWLVTQECIATPLIPVYLAAALTLSRTNLRRILAVLAAVPLFTLLGTARLLVLAVPPAFVGSHDVAVHAFYQVLVGLLIVGLAAFAMGRRQAMGASSPLADTARAAGAGVLSGLVVAALTQRLWPLVAALPDSYHLGHGYSDPQGALTLLPAFQVALMVALWLSLVRPLLDRGLGLGLGLLLASQVAILLALGELAMHLQVEAPIAGIRAYTLAAPILVAWWLARGPRAEPRATSARPVALHG